MYKKQKGSWGQSCCPHETEIPSIRICCAFSKPHCIQRVKTNFFLERGSSSSHNTAFLLVVEWVCLFVIATGSNNYRFLVSLLLILSLCHVCFLFVLVWFWKCEGGGIEAICMFYFNSPGCFLVLINPTMPRALFKHIMQQHKSWPEKAMYVVPCASYPVCTSPPRAFHYLALSSFFVHRWFVLLMLTSTTALPLLTRLPWKLLRLRNWEDPAVALENT